jgi:GT2 family glycosyltransferase
MNRPAAGAPHVSIIVPVHGQWRYTSRCLEAIAQATQDVRHQVIVVDNGSADETAQALATFGGVEVIQNRGNQGYAAACNQGAAVARGQHLLFLNNDTEPRGGWLRAMVAVLETDPQIAVVAPQLVFPNGTIQHAGFIVAYGFPYPVSLIPRAYGKAPAAAAERVELRAVSGACALVRGDVFRSLGGFDEGFVNGYEDADLCFRVVEAGRRIIYTPDAVVLHHEAVSGGRFKNEAANLDRLQQRWMERWTRFDYDYRVSAGQGGGAAPRPRASRAREPVSVVVVAHNALATVIPALENIHASLRAGDELLVVDNGSRGASAAALEFFAAQHPAVTRITRAPARLEFGPAARLGLQAACHPLAALLPANVKVPPSWLDRLAAALSHDPSIGVLSASGSGNPVSEVVSSYAPPDARARASVLENLVTAGPRTTPVPATSCLMGRRDELLVLAQDPTLLLGPAADALSLHLAARGRRLAAAQDVFVARINQQAAEPHVPDRERYLVQQSARLAAERTGDPGAPLCSVVILIRDNLPLTAACIASIYQHTRHFELILVDNGSAADVAAHAAALQARHGNVVYLRNQRNEGFAYGVNQGLAAARGEYLVVLNNDVVVTPGWLSRQLALLSVDSRLALVGPTTNATSGRQLVGTPTYAGLSELETFSAQWTLEHSGELAFVDRLVGLCMVMPRRLIDEVGGFDTIFGYGNCEDDDFCLRVKRAGYQIAIAYDVFIHHHGSSTFKALSLDAGALVAENWEIFCQKWRHASKVHTEEALRVLATSAVWDRATDRVPVVYAEAFNPSVPPIALDCDKPVRWLHVADWRQAGWADALSPFFRAFNSADPVALIVRVEPPTPEALDRVVAGLNGLLAALAISLHSAPDIVIEASSLPPARRGGLYTAATAYLRSAGGRQGFYAREAAACGLAQAGLNDDLRLLLSRQTAGAPQPAAR